MNKPRMLLGMGIVVLIIFLIGLSVKSASVAKNQDMTLLGIENVAAKLAEEQQVVLHVHGKGATVLSGADGAKLISGRLVDWKAKESVKPNQDNPDLTLYIQIGTDDKLEFFAAEPNWVRVVYAGKWRDYTVSQAVFEDFKMRAMISSYRIPEQVIQAITEGERTSRVSVSDVPQNKTFTVLKLGELTYYLYEENGNYYVESPYHFISKISETLYNGAKAFAEPSEADVIPTETGTEEKIMESFAGELGPDYEKVGALKSGTEVYFEKQGFFNKLEKGSRIVLKIDDNLYTLADQYPGRPEISPNGETLAFIDMIEFEVKGNAFIYRDSDSSIRQLTHYTYGTEAIDANINTVKDCLWLNDEELLLVIGFATGTVSQGGDVYLMNTATDAKQVLLFKSKKNEEVANMKTEKDHFVFEIVYWTDDSLNTFAYREESFTLQQILDMKK